ncbi:MAG: hypothetical protein OXI78_00645 [Anaerolineaceae bacterium]|nr:hypothetical protein [Anaerolineaceae bacterium]
MSLRWSVHLDHNDDGRFDEAGEDLSQAVLAIRWRRGMGRPHDSVAQPGQAEITLRNRDGRYSPERGALAQGRLLQVRSHDGAQSRVHFTGHVARVEAQAGALGSRRALLIARDASAQLAGHHIRLPPLNALRADEIIERCLDAVPLRRGRLRGTWLLGQAGQGELGRNTGLAPLNIGRQLGRDSDRLARAGDSWATGIPALAAIAEVCAAVRGRFHIDHEGRAVYLSRHQLLLQVAAQAGFRDDMQDLRYSWADERVSQVEVLLTPRRRGQPGVVWTLGQALAIDARQDDAQQVLLRYRDATGQPCGALDLIAPLAGRDWQANSRPDGRGRDLTGNLTLLLREAGISAALLEIRNSGRTTAWLQAGAQLRGTPLYSGDPLLVTQRSLGSENRFGPAALRLDLPALDSLDQARSLARFELARRQTPRGHVHSLGLSGADRVARALARRLFDRIRIEEAQTCHRDDYFIIGEEVEVTPEAGARLTWRLESAHSPFWLLGRGQLNRDALLAW